MSPPPPPRLLLLLPLLDPESSSPTSVTTTLSESLESLGKSLSATATVSNSASDEGEDEMSSCGAAKIAAMEAARATRISDLFKLDLIVTGVWEIALVMIPQALEGRTDGWLQVFFCSSSPQGILLLVL